MQNDYNNIGLYFYLRIIMINLVTGIVSTI